MPLRVALSLLAGQQECLATGKIDSRRTEITLLDDLHSPCRGVRRRR
jgi:hypothetical protein